MAVHSNHLNRLNRLNHHLAGAQRHHMRRLYGQAHHRLPVYTWPNMRRAHLSTQRGLGEGSHACATRSTVVVHALDGAQLARVALVHATHAAAGTLVQAVGTCTPPGVCVVRCWHLLSECSLRGLVPWVCGIVAGFVVKVPLHQVQGPRQLRGVFQRVEGGYAQPHDGPA